MSMDAMAAAEKLPETENDGRISVSDDAPIPATSSEETKPPPGEISDEAGLRIAIEEELRRLIIEQAVFDAADSRLRGGDGEEVSEIVEEGNRSTDSGDTATEKFLRLFQNPDWLRSYPVRADAEDCSYYMKFGSCKYGFFCKFNHPPRPTSQYFKERPKRRDGNSEKTTGCKFIMTSGGCKYGNECKFSHVSEKRFTPEIPELNFLGLPLRPGESECPYYMRNASCKYGANCKFHHPDPTSGGGGGGRSSSPPGFSNGNKAMSSQHAPSSSIASSWETTTPSLQTAMFRGSTDPSDQETKWHQESALRQGEGGD
ncbi:hypothetical protein M569_10789 [Genlisea aurea]|uniref:C3H1-type domain-containing protein n=1 Tax=Genlisea aurea TaxID=192259 RepID=S8DLZ0_9LAMI|nr:hypothetical protein M569_10789 [Genlisea aurea]